MNKILILPLCCICFVSCQHRNSVSYTEKFIDSLMSETYAANQPGAVILVADNGKPVFRKAYGLANYELNIPNKPEYDFAIAAMTKQFTAGAILQLAQNGKLSLQDDVREYLPDYNTHGKTVTIKNLLTHTSGIPSFTENKDFEARYTKDYTHEEQMEYMMKDSLLFDPNTDWSYSNSGYFLCGMIIEKVSGMKYEEYMQRNIFIPLQMTHTYFGQNITPIPGLVGGYFTGNDSVMYKSSYYSWSWAYSSEGLVTCVDDLLKWDEALYSDKIVKQEWLEKAWTPDTLNDGRSTHYGFGWTVNDVQNTKLIEHGGAIDGFLCEAIRIPSKHIYVVVLCNNYFRDPGGVVRAVAMKMAGISTAPPAAVEISTTQLREYAGAYEMHRHGSKLTANSTKEKVLRIVNFRNDSIYNRMMNGRESALTYVGKDLFMNIPGGPYFQFHRDTNNKLSALEIYSATIKYGPNEYEPKSDLPIAKEPKEIQIAPEVLKQYAGRYDLGEGTFLTITTEVNRIFGQETGFARFEMFAESENKFFLKGRERKIVFEKDAAERVTGLVLTQGGNMKGKKVE
ncbi:MAG: serine hydrolase [Chitinophagales bacterium]|nr:serine hydrolase [Chitinophagales bacterium]